MIVTHPNNRKLLEAELTDDSSRRAYNDWGLDTLYGLPITFNEYMPERATQEEWHPPAGDRFTEYDASDEAWMRPLGMGRTVTIDCGPLFWDVPGIKFPRFYPTGAIL